MILGFFLLLLIFGAWLWLQFHKRHHGLRVLLYHKVRTGPADSLTVSPQQLRQHLQALIQAEYEFISAQTLLSHLSDSAKLPKRAVLLTFDDGYADLLVHALPILRELNLPAVFFIPTAHIGGYNDWDGATDALMTTNELSLLAQEGFALAYHSHQHLNYRTLTIEEITDDLTENVATGNYVEIKGNHMGLPLQPLFAYPYGGRPTNKTTRQAMYQTMKQLGIRLSFRIGNRINPWPVANPYEVNRIDVRGVEPLKTFLWRVHWGKWL